MTFCGEDPYEPLCDRIKIRPFCPHCGIRLSLPNVVALHTCMCCGDCWDRRNIGASSPAVIDGRKKVEPQWTPSVRFDTREYDPKESK